MMPVAPFTLAAGPGIPLPQVGGLDRQWRRRPGYQMHI
jgi:hypothetical protein